MAYCNFLVLSSFLPSSPLPSLSNFEPWIHPALVLPQSPLRPPLLLFLASLAFNFTKRMKAAAAAKTAERQKPSPEQTRRRRRLRPFVPDTSSCGIHATSFPNALNETEMAPSGGKCAQQRSSALETISSFPPSLISALSCGCNRRNSQLNSMVDFDYDHGTRTCTSFESSNG